MIESYRKLLDMESIVSLKLDQDKKALEKTRNILYMEKSIILEKLIKYLKKELNIEYFMYEIIDIDGNIADILVKKDSKIFNEKIKDKEYLNCNVEELIDIRIYDNLDEIILVNLNFESKLVNIGYLCDSLDYKFLSYSQDLIYNLTLFIDYIINKKLEEN